uniref:Uncharacterized protein n=1 Tax=Arundo donax TaxID=35708 RepID=A0A0A9BM91_ARUDO
MVVHRLAMVR